MWLYCTRFIEEMPLSGGIGSSRYSVKNRGRTDSMKTMSCCCRNHQRDRVYIVKFTEIVKRKNWKEAESFLSHSTADYLFSIQHTLVLELKGKIKIMRTTLVYLLYVFCWWLYLCCKKQIAKSFAWNRVKPVLHIWTLRRWIDRSLCKLLMCNFLWWNW